MDDILNANARAVLEALRASASHPTAQEVYDEVRQTRPRIWLATVYRILRQLSEQGVIKVWGYARTHRHDHAFCTECGALLDQPVEVELSREALEKAAHATGIEMGSHEVRIYGRCQSCQARNKA
jgi:Fe2+ or Zn2+ uptake regulation protein